MSAGKKASGGLTGRYVLCHTLRSPGKSLLCLALTVVFLLGLMLIRVSTVRSENELEHLYTTTEVKLEIIKSGAGNGSDGNGAVFRSTVDDLEDTGFIGHRYVEGLWKNAFLTRLDAQGKLVDKGRFSTGNVVLYGIEYPQEFFTLHNLRGEITYFEGWDESAFLQSREDWKGRNPASYWTWPVVIPQSLYEEFQMAEGDMLQVEIVEADPLSVDKKSYLTDLTVIGTHSCDTNAVLFPLLSLQGVNGVDLRYDQVILTIDPAKNRQLDEFRTMAADIIAGGGTVPLITIYWDQELRQAIAPMEQVISFMKALYPVTLALSFIVAAGIAVLLSLLSAKEAAILRVLGNSKMTCRVTLCLQTILPCIAGLVLGHLGAGAMAYLMLPAEQAAGLMIPALGRAGLYLLYTVLGAVGASAVMTSKNPLELLQVKE
ncbi:MAG: hypothetical protein J6J87_02920 [Oscillospiraceae bacterium]|nr:hypothetical protein [Oscillospiraceae bacterium]